MREIALFRRREQSATRGVARGAVEPRLAFGGWVLTVEINRDNPQKVEPLCMEWGHAEGLTTSGRAGRGVHARSEGDLGTWRPRASEGDYSRTPEVSNSGLETHTPLTGREAQLKSLRPEPGRAFSISASPVPDPWCASVRKPRTCPPRLFRLNGKQRTCHGAIDPDQTITDRSLSPADAKPGG